VGLDHALIVQSDLQLQPVRRLQRTEQSQTRNKRRRKDAVFPWRHLKGPRKGELDWKPLQHHTVLRVLHNPRYAGAFTYGRHRHQKRPNGKWSATMLPREEWISFIPDAHPGYITLEEFDANRAPLAANAAAHGRDRTCGPPREGPALL